MNSRLSMVSAILLAACLIILAAAPRPVDCNVIEQYAAAERFSHSESPVVTENETKYVYNIPIDDELQLQIYEICDEYGVDNSLIFAMMYVESRYIADKIGDNGNSYGLLQIQPRWWSATMDQVGATDLLNPIENVKTGCAIIQYLYSLYGDERSVLQAYNTGKPYTDNGYANKVYAARDRLEVRPYADGGCY